MVAVVVNAPAEEEGEAAMVAGGGRQERLLTLHVCNATPSPLRLVPVIDVLLASRLDAQRRRAFDKANTICKVLLNVHGVSMWDKDRTWSTCGGRGERGSGREGRGGRGERGGGCLIGLGGGAAAVEAVPVGG